MSGGWGGQASGPSLLHPQTPLDFFLWGYVKEKVIGAEYMKVQIRDVTTTINRGMFAHTWG
jgi:hypothetical protein